MVVKPSLDHMCLNKFNKRYILKHNPSKSMNILAPSHLLHIHQISAYMRCIGHFVIAIILIAPSLFYLRTFVNNFHKFKSLFCWCVSKLLKLLYQLSPGIVSFIFWKISSCLILFMYICLLTLIISSYLSI